MIQSIGRDEYVSERVLDDDTLGILFANVDVLRDILDHDAASSSGSSLSMVSDDLVSLEDDDEISPMWHHEPPTRQVLDPGTSWANSHIAGREFTDDQFVKQNPPSASNLCRRTLSPVPCATPSDFMEKLAECMDRSALSRNLVESFCQLSLKKCSKSPKRSIESGRRTRRLSIIKTRNVLHKHTLEKRKGMKTASTPEKKRTLCRKHGAVSKRQQKNSPEQKDPDFRSSGVKMSEDKLKRLDAKLKLLNSEEDRPSDRVAETRPCAISSFLRRHKSSVSIESARSA
jgi:hypothetical protein